MQITEEEASLSRRECPICGRYLELKQNHRTGKKFLACPAFPACNFTISYYDYKRNLDLVGLKVEEIKRNEVDTTKK